MNRSVLLLYNLLKEPQRPVSISSGLKLLWLWLCWVFSLTSLLSGQTPPPLQCEIDPSVFEPPPEYTTLGPGRSEPMRDEDDNLLQFAIQQSLLDAGTESDQVMVSNHMVYPWISILMHYTQDTPCTFSSWQALFWLAGCTFAGCMFLSVFLETDLFSKVLGLYDLRESESLDYFILFYYCIFSRISRVYIRSMIFRVHIQTLTSK